MLLAERSGALAAADPLHARKFALGQFRGFAGNSSRRSPPASSRVSEGTMDARVELP